MLLYEHPLSSFSQKVKIALREKGVAFRTETPETFQTERRDGPFNAANPRREVPVLIDGETRIFDSTIIMEYVEERWREPALLPPDPAARASARMTEEVCDTQFEAINWAYGEIFWFRRATGELADCLKAEAARQTRIMLDWLAGRLGDAEWLGGDRFGWADIAAVPLVNRCGVYGLGPADGTPLALWLERAKRRPSVAATFAEFAGMLDGMSAVADLYRPGGRRREYRDHRLEWLVKSGGIEIVREGLRDRNIRFSWPDPA